MSCRVSFQRSIQFQIQRNANYDNIALDAGILPLEDSHLCQLTVQLVLSLARLIMIFFVLCVCTLIGMYRTRFVRVFHLLVSREELQCIFTTVTDEIRIL